MKDVQSRLSKLKIALLASLAVFSVPVLVMAASTTITSTAKFLGAITLTPTNMNFGNITWAAAPGASDNVVLKTDGTLTYAGTFANGGGTPVVGNVHIVGASGNAVSIYCTASTTLGLAGGHSIALNTIKIAQASDVATNGVACQGLGTAAYAAYTLTAADDFKIGAKIDGTTTASFISGTYTTTAGAGDIQVVVLYN